MCYYFVLKETIYRWDNEVFIFKQTNWEKKENNIKNLQRERKKTFFIFLNILISTSLLENTVSGLLIFLLSCNLLCRVFPVKIKNSLSLLPLQLIPFIQTKDPLIKFENNWILIVWKQLVNYQKGFL